MRSIRTQRRWPLHGSLELLGVYLGIAGLVGCVFGGLIVGTYEIGVVVLEELTSFAAMLLGAGLHRLSLRARFHEERAAAREAAARREEAGPPISIGEARPGLVHLEGTVVLLDRGVGPLERSALWLRRSSRMGYEPEQELGLERKRGGRAVLVERAECAPFAVVDGTGAALLELEGPGSFHILPRSGDPLHRTRGLVEASEGDTVEVVGRAAWGETSHPALRDRAGPARGLRSGERRALIVRGDADEPVLLFAAARIQPRDR